MLNIKLYFTFFLIGVFVSLLFPPFFLTPFGFIIFPLLFSIIINKNFKLLGYKKHFICGLLLGIGFFIVYLDWIKEPFFIDEINKKYSIFSYLLILYCSLFFGFILTIIMLFKNDVIKFFVFPSVVVLCEFICANFIYGFPWFSFSLIHSANIIGNSLIYYFGTYFLSYLSILFFLAPAIFLFKDKKYKKNTLIFYLILIIIIITLTFLRNTKYQNDKTYFQNISLVQLNYPINQYLDHEKIKNKLSNIVDIIKKNKSDILIFGENEYPYLLDDKNIKFLQNHITNNQYLIIGASRKENNKYFNSFFLIEKNKFQKFDKKILVPFGEFIPLRNLFKFMEYIAGAVNFSKGNEARILNLKKDLDILPVICYEILYFWKILNKDNYNSKFLVNLTNDSWFGNFSGPYQHFYFTKLRSSEFNKPIIRISNNGISAIINKYGKIIIHTKLNQKEIVTGKVIINEIQGNYQKIHNILMIIILSLIFILYIIDIKNEKRKI